MPILHDDLDTPSLYAVAAVLPDRSRVDRAVEALRAAGIASDAIWVMHSTEGLHLPGRPGAAPGVRSWVRRLVVHWTYYERLFGLYAENLQRGEFLLVVPSSPADRQRVALLLSAHRAGSVRCLGLDPVEQS